MKVEKIIITEDGSHTMKLEGIQEHYHSTFGALSESMHVFIGAGLHHLKSSGLNNINILEIGLGTGLNALLSICDSWTQDANITYTAIEAYPLEEDVWSRLNYPRLMKHDLGEKWFEMLHMAPWNDSMKISENFILTKLKIDLLDFTDEPDKYNLIYFDAFGPDIQPELWTEEIFTKIAEMTAGGGVLVTYSAKGSVRRAMQTAGFVVERIPGPKGKREMLRGVLEMK